MHQVALRQAIPSSAWAAAAGKAPEAAGGGEVSVVHDAEHNLWGAVIPLSLEVKGESKPVALPVQIILIGAAMP